MLMETGRPSATATERSRVNSVHHIRFHNRLSVFVSCEPSTLGKTVSSKLPHHQHFSAYLLCMPEP